MSERKVLDPYHRFSKAEWAKYRDGEPMTLAAADIERLRALTDPISLAEAEEIYLPLSRLISFYVEAAQAVHRVATRFLGAEDRKIPFIIGVAGSVASGKSTTSRILRALLQRWRTSPKVDLVTTDGFLYPNTVLEARGLSRRKGFPESYDRPALVSFLSDIKSSKPQVRVPVYSHLVYDVVPDKFVVVDRPDILIVEGLNILQPGELPKTGKPILFASDFIDFSIYIDADEAALRHWFMVRFRALRESAFTDPKSFFRQLAEMPAAQAEAFGLQAWDEINLPNLQGKYPADAGPRHADPAQGRQSRRRERAAAAGSRLSSPFSRASWLRSRTGRAPICEITSLAARQPALSAVRNSRPRASARRKPAAKRSPAPVASTTSGDRIGRHSHDLAIADRHRPLRAHGDRRQLAILAHLLHRLRRANRSDRATWLPRYWQTRSRWSWTASGRETPRGYGRRRTDRKA